MKEISRRRIMVMSSLNEISTDQLGNSREGYRHYSTRPHPFSTADFWTDAVFKDDVNGFRSSSVIFFMITGYINVMFLIYISLLLS
jgi:hypothetical protein